MPIALCMASFILIACGNSKEKNKNPVTLKDPTLSDLIGTPEAVIKNETEQYPYSYFKQLSKARSFFENTQYYEAIAIYNALQDDYGVTIDIAIDYGETYYRMGNYKVAQNLFTEAIAHNAFATHTKWSLVYYRMALISYSQQDEDSFVADLVKIVEKDVESDESMSSIMLTQGIDTMVAYFSIKPNFSYEAYRELGLYFILKGDVEKGIIYTLSALAMATTWAVRDVMRVDDPSFVFTDLQYLLERLLQNQRGRDFLKESEVARVLYALKRYFAIAEVPRNSTVKINQAQYIQYLLTMVDNDDVFATSDTKRYYPVIHL